MTLRLLLAVISIVANIVWLGNSAFAQAIDIIQDANPGSPGNFGTTIGSQGTPLVLTNPTSVLQRLAIEEQLKSGELAKKVLGGETTLTEKQLTDRLGELLQPAFSPGDIVVLSAPQFSPAANEPWKIIPYNGNGGTSYRPTSVAPDSVALINQTEGSFEFRLTIGGAGKNARLLPNEFRTFECSPDCAAGALVNFDSLNAASPGEMKIQGGAVYSVSFSDAAGWTVVKVEKLSFVILP